MGFPLKGRRDRIAIAARRKDIRAAMERVLARRDKPPWTDHPRPLDLSLSMAGALSDREARWVRNHLASCAACRERKERLARELAGARSPRAAAEIVRAAERAHRG